MFFNLSFFVVVLPVAILAYAVAPRRYRWAVLLAVSYLCLWHSGKRLVAFLVVTTLSSYLCGLRIAALNEQRKAALAETGVSRRAVKEAFAKRSRRVVAVGVILNLGMLFVCKYLGFMMEVVRPLFDLVGVALPAEAPRIGMPPGISFYTFIAISYIVDVHRGSVKPDRDLGSVALFLSFFPQMLEGPMNRYGQTAEDLKQGNDVTAENLYLGLLRMLYGIMKKVVVADRLNAFVETVFDGYAQYDGGIIALAAVVYTLQLYCDFSGTIDVALGIARIFGVRMAENFRQPFFSKTASEFWQRWHITLGAWFKDYVYYPVSLSAPCKRLTTAARKKLGLRYGPLLAGSVALFCVWFCNGLWHGSGSQYLFFGMYYFVIITAGGLVEPVMQDLSSRFGFDRNGLPYRLFQGVRTLVIVFAGELIFRANGLRAGLEMLCAIVTRFSLEAFANGGVFALGIDAHDFAISAIILGVVFVVDLLKERGHDVSANVAERSRAVRWAILGALLLIIIVFGAYGVEYTPVDPMYAQF